MDVSVKGPSLRVCVSLSVYHFSHCMFATVVEYFASPLEGLYCGHVRRLTRRCGEPRPAPMRNFEAVSSSSLQPCALSRAVCILDLVRCAFSDQPLYPMTNRTLPRNLWRSIVAVFLGFVAVVVLSLGTDQVFHMLRIYPPWNQPMREPGLNLLALSYRIIYTVVGGFITARLAPRNPMRHVSGYWQVLGLSWVRSVSSLRAAWTWARAGIRSRLRSRPCLAPGSAEFSIANAALSDR